MVPYVVQNGKALYPKRKEEMLEINRWKQFSKVLVHALALAQKQRDEDPRIKAIVTQEYPLILNPSDFTPCNDITGETIPIFGWDTLTSCEYSWPIPDYKIFDMAQSVKKWDRDIATWERDYPWESKLRKAVWRGTMNGGNVKDWREMPRAKLVQRSLDDRNRTIDAAFAQHSNPSQLNAKRREKEEEATRASMTVPRMPELDYMKYRAILDTDGNGWSGRFGPIMCYNSVVIKVRVCNMFTCAACVSDLHTKYSSCLLVLDRIRKRIHGLLSTRSQAMGTLHSCASEPDGPRECRCVCSQ